MRLSVRGKRALRRPLIILRHRGLRSADVLLVSYPRSGSNWVRFILFEALTGLTPEFGGLTYQMMPEVGDQTRASRLLPDGGRLVKSHETFVGRVEKAVYLVRDPRDIILSEHRAKRRLGDWSKEEIDDSFVRGFVDGGIDLFGTWDRHVSYWRASRIARENQLLLVRYEDLRADPWGRVGDIMTFLGVEASPEGIERAVQANSLEEMRKKEAAPPADTKLVGTTPDLAFVGQGRVEGWRGRLSTAHASLIAGRMGPVLESLGYPLD